MTDTISDCEQVLALLREGRNEDDLHEAAKAHRAGKDRPRIYLCASTAKLPHKRGTGARFSIMAMPRAWEHGDGTLQDFVPPKALLRAFQKGEVSAGFYFAELRRRWAKDVAQWDDNHSPGFLFARLPGGQLQQVQSGDALFCGCAEGKPCHRRLAAEFLHLAGWDVVLDGQPFVGAARLLPEEG